jgi:hypothetical protein
MHRRSEIQGPDYRLLNFVSLDLPQQSRSVREILELDLLTARRSRCAAPGNPGDD